MQRHEQRYRIAERIRRLNELGFDVDEVELIDDPGGGSRLRLTTRVAEPGHHRRRLLFARTGLDVQENQARRLLADIASFRGWMEQVEQPAGAGGGRRQPVAGRGLPADVEAIPPRAADRLDAGRDLPRDPRAPVVPLRGGRRATSAPRPPPRTTSRSVLPEVPEDLVTPAAAGRAGDDRRRRGGRVPLHRPDRLDQRPAGRHLARGRRRGPGRYELFVPVQPRGRRSGRRRAVGAG